MSKPDSPSDDEQRAEAPDNRAEGNRAEGEKDAHKKSARHTLTVVGIGASAGGLSALQALFGALQPDSDMAFVVVTHMSPDQESLLPDLLPRSTTMPVSQASVDATLLEPNHVYVIPPARQIVITDSHLSATEFTEPRGKRKPIDLFFRSLGAVHRDAVGVILSGGGTDGVVGMKAIKESGGFLLVQDPAEAEYDGMPRAAIETDLVDVVGPVRELAAKLIQFQQLRPQISHDPAELSEMGQDTLRRILLQVHTHTGHDFNEYKRSTILRRIERRMQVHGVRSLVAYLALLRSNMDEAHALFADLLISVTRFFRDPESWEAMAEQVIPQLFEGKQRGETVRVWVVGCATGEEAYTLGMLLLEHAAGLRTKIDIQVFASDLDEGALNRARTGLYPAAIEADVSSERLQHFFVQERDHYRVTRELRDTVLFTSHSILRDPPFSRLDLISSRNLLIYLQRSLQNNIFQVFHYALHPEGYLFIGSAETAEAASDLFQTVDKTHRIYRARAVQDEHARIPQFVPQTTPQTTPETTPQTTSTPTLPTTTMPKVDPSLEQEFRNSHSTDFAPIALLHQQTLEQFGPPSILVDEEYNTVHLSETAGRYLHMPGGVPTSNVLELVRPELQFELRKALFHAFGRRKPSITRPVAVNFNGHHPVTMIVRPREDSVPDVDESEQVVQEERRRYALVVFIEDDLGGERQRHDSAGEREHDVEPDVERLENEVRYLRGRLQATVEEYEGANEELKSANEELQSINEEFRSTAEELETSKEELQSMNEELQTVNSELKSKLDEISHAHSDLENLMAMTEIAIVFLDRDLRIMRYTTAMEKVFHIMPGDRGRPITHLNHTLYYDGIAEDARAVLRSLVPSEHEVQRKDDSWFRMRIRPYRTLDDHIEGVVITFVDITTSKEHELALSAAKKYAESIVDTIPDSLLVLTTDLRVRTANDTFYEMFQVPQDQTEGRLVYELGNGQWDIPELHTLLEEILPENNIFYGYEVEHTFDQVGRRTMLLNGRRLDHVQFILLSITDITERKEMEEALVSSEERYRSLFESMDEAFCIIELIFDEEDKPIDYKFLVTNPAFAEHTGLHDAVGKRMRKLQPDHEEYWFEIYGRIALTGKPERFTNEAKQLGDRFFDVYAFRLDPPEERKVAVLFKDFTQRKRADEALQQSEARFRAVANLVPDLLWENDPRGCVTWYNQSWLAYTGQTLEEAQGDGWVDVIHPDERERTRARMQTAIQSGGPLRHELLIRNAAGHYRWFLLQAQPNRNEAGEITNWFGAATDIHEQRIALAREREMNQKLERRVRERTEQVRSLVSELTMSEQAERRRISSLLHDDLQQLLYSVQYQLQFARRDIEAGQPDEALAQMVNLSEHLDSAVAITRNLSVNLSPPVLHDEGLAEALGWLASQMKREHGLAVTVEKTESLPRQDEDQRVMLFQLVRELLFNVIKHAGVDAAKVKLRRFDNVLEIGVQDYGKGFVVEEMNEPEERSHGLVHVRQRIELIGGRMQIDSAPGEGTKIVLTCPITD